jgi:D-alanine-D-alanine ligase
MIIYHSPYNNGKPVRNLTKKPPWRIALIANSKTDFERGLEDPPDAGSEFDSLATIESIAAAMEAEGHWVHFLQADYTLPEALNNLRPQICFNIAEGLQGNGREAHVPALCELMGIPYTSSRVVASAIGLDKTQTKRIWRDAGLPTARFYEVACREDLAKIDLPFPLFVKPSREGSGMGVNNTSIIKDRRELNKVVKYLLNTYQQPVLVEEYLPGREFTVGFIGNPGSPEKRHRPEIYDREGYHWFPIMEIDSGACVSPSVYGHEAKTIDIGHEGAPGYLCPAMIPPQLHDELIALAKKAARALDACDVARIDIRLGADQKPYLLEINTLPGLNPALSDLCIQAASEGMTYQTLITEILYLAAERYHLPLPEKAGSRETEAVALPAFREQQPAVLHANRSRY